MEEHKDGAQPTSGQGGNELALRAWLFPQIIPAGKFPLSDGSHAECESIMAEIDPRTYATGPMQDGPPPQPLMVPTSLLSLRVTETNLHVDFSQRWRLLHEAVQQWCMFRMSPLDCYSARIDLAEFADGVRREFLVYPGWPPPFSGSALPGGFGLEGSVAAFRSMTAPPHVTRAIGWWLKALRTLDSYDRVIASWLAIESLAKEPGMPAAGHVTKRIVRCLLRVGVSDKNARLLYQTRSQLVHGDLTLDSDVAEKLGNHAFEVMDYALRLIKLELGWPPDAPPFLRQENGCHAGRFSHRGWYTPLKPTSYQQPIMLTVSPVLVWCPKVTASPLP